MTSHELARHLLNGPDLPVATHANNHTATEVCMVGVLQHWSGPHVVIGNHTLQYAVSEHTLRLFEI